MLLPNPAIEESIDMSKTNVHAVRPTATQREKREAFQAFLDDHFPRGAMCVTLGFGERLSGSADPVATGRLICTSATQDDHGRWWYQLVIDPRRSLHEDVEALSLWVGQPTQKRETADLWESDVRSDSARPRVLRLNANPPEHWRPTKRMWQVVSETYTSD